MYKLAAILFLLILSLSLKSQNLQFDWVRFGKGLNYSNGNFTALNNNRIFLSGFFLDSVKFQSNFLKSRGSYDIYLKKYDRNGNEYGVFQIGGTSNDNVRSLKLDNNKKILVSGHFTQNCQFGSFNMVAPTTDFFIAKYDTLGNFIWAKNIESSYLNTSWDLAIDNANNYYCAGYFAGTATYNSVNINSAGLNDAFLLKIDENGNIIWFNRYGGIGSDEGRSIMTDQNNDVVFSGIYSKNVIFQNDTIVSRGGVDIFILKTDPNGNKIWLKSIGSKLDDYSSRVIKDCDNNYYITGFFQDTAWFDNQMFVSKGQRDIFLAKISPAGNYIWIKTFGGKGIESPSCFAIKSCDEMYLTGYITDTAFFDSSVLNATDQDIFLMKFNRAGNIRWAEKFGGLGVNSASSVSVNNNDIYLSGYYNNMQIFDNNSFPTAGNFDSFLAKFTEINNNPLPVDLVDYKIKCIKTGSLITWTTLSETNNNYFTIEKTTDLKNWKVVSNIQSAFNSSEVKEYSVIDNSVNSDELTYYRLKQTDVDGKYKYFDVLSVLCNLKNDLLEIIGVNVSELHVNVIITTDGYDPVLVELKEISGKLILGKTMTPIEGANIVSIENIGLSKGTYIVAVRQNEIVKSKKIIIN